MISKCLFPAAGYGTRFLPATKAIPKEMLPILNKPLLQYGVEEALEAGIKNMSIVTGRGKRAIEDHFDNAYELESQLKGTSKQHLMNEIREVIEKATFTYTRQQNMIGLGNAILTGKSLIGNEPFAVLLADDLCQSNSEGVLSQMVKVYDKYKCTLIAIEDVPEYQVSNYGIISGELIDDSNNIYSVKDMVEKPKSENAPSNLAIIGRYILTPDIFEILAQTKEDENGEIQLTSALFEQAKKGNVLAYKFNGHRFDCGSTEGFLKATNYVAKKIGYKDL